MESLKKAAEKKQDVTTGSKKPPAPIRRDLEEEERARRRGGQTGEGEEAGMSGGEGRRLLRKKTASKRNRNNDDDSGPVNRRHIIHKRGTSTAAPRKGNVVLELPATVRSFSEAAGVPAAKVISKLMQQFGRPLGSMNVNSELDDETAQLLAAEMGVELDFKVPESLEATVISGIESIEDAAEDLETRPPVVTFLGHVDHGKTSLLDKIIGIDVVSGESGGITQHIRAYKVAHNGHPITFVDTPGHEAFTEMRARGANVTDIAVLVVAANDGVMPQTEEAISHAKAAGVPIVVALNKIDLPGINQEKVFQQLATADLLPTQWGGDVEVVPCSAHTGVGVDDLLEMLLTVAELHGLKANPKRKAIGTCLEAEMHEGRGVIAKFIVQNGTLRPGDSIVCGSSFGRVRAMFNTLKTQERVEEASPSTPVNVTGLDEAPAAGQKFYVLEDIAEARQIAELRHGEQMDIARAGGRKNVTLENLFDTLDETKTQTLNLILRADTRGSIEAIKKELTKLEHPEVQVRLLQAMVGGVTEADVHLADASSAVIIGFNVIPDEKARTLADQRGVQVRRYDIIYEITDHLRKALERKLKPEEREVELGRALVKRVFAISRIGTIAGSHVLQGTIERGCRARVFRDNQQIGDYVVDSLKREKDDAREVRQGLECGIRLSGFNDLKEGDMLLAYKKEEIARTL
jgi:translation initiation factor IF-2